jgi:hypothetical protein
MKAKLTLSIEQDKIEKIKKYAENNGHSVSKFVEDIIDKLEKKQNPKKLDIMKIKGAFGKVPKDFDWKKIKTEYLLKKYVE